MAEYINREAVCENCLYNKNCQFIATHKGETVTDCSAYKNAADVVEVVRCKECDVPHNKWTGCPNLNGLIPPPDFYCARGERKGGEGE